MIDSNAHVARLTHSRGLGDSTSAVVAPVFGQLIQQPWTEMEEARDRYNQDAKRLRYWRWWFVGMFTFYTTLAGILLLNLVAGP